MDRIALSPAEAAAALGCTRQTIYNLIARGELNRYKVGRSTKLNAARFAPSSGVIPLQEPPNPGRAAASPSAGERGGQTNDRCGSRSKDNDTRRTAVNIDVLQAIDDLQAGSYHALEFLTTRAEQTQIVSAFLEQRGISHRPNSSRDACTTCRTRNDPNSPPPTASSPSSRATSKSTASHTPCHRPASCRG